MINRRSFLTTSAAFGATLIGLPRSLELISGYAAADTIITILHTNDTHSQIEPLPPNDANAGKGGVARRATLVKRVRQQNPNTLLVDAGDVMQGTPYFNFYRGEVEYKAMSAIGYDVGTLGNHEFDNGVEDLAKALKFANFDLVSANYDVKGTVLEGRVKPYVVKTVGGIKVGLFGLGISPVALITPANFKGVTYNDPVVAAREVVKTLREKERCSLVVCMSHLGYYVKGDRGDTLVASQVDGIDFIAGGHTHTFMKEPVKQKQPCGAETLIFQVGKSGINVGRVDFTFRTGKLIAVSARLLDFGSQNG
ncbi:MAG TPA: metallophosphatase [Pyrinomonadaceae bacterium]|jgi:5'-nucleotidase|nr:metallophosphatase [Pyrinomonadaceae bacterium]